MSYKEKIIFYILLFSIATSLFFINLKLTALKNEYCQTQQNTGNLCTYYIKVSSNTLTNEELEKEFNELPEEVKTGNRPIKFLKKNDFFKNFLKVFGISI